MRNFPVPSTTVAMAGTRTSAAGPSSAIRPSRITTEWLARGAEPVIGITVTFRTTTERCSGAPRGMQAGATRRIIKEAVRLHCAKTTFFIISDESAL
jgi:hypothetical protein